jgi:hypothetical protein
VSSSRPETVLQSFRAEGILPMDAEVILKRFNTASSDNREVLSSEPKGNGSSWKKLHCLYDFAVNDNGGAATKDLSGPFHSLQVHNELLLHENTGFRDALTIERKRSKKGKTLDLQQRKEFKSAAVSWSSRKIREALARESVREEEQQAEKLGKSETKRTLACSPHFCLFLSAPQALVSNFCFVVLLNSGVGNVMMWAGVELCKEHGGGLWIVNSDDDYVEFERSARRR